MNLDIREQDKELIEKIIKSFAPEIEIWAYGSRVKGGATPKSDLDLVAFANKKQQTKISELVEAFEESNLPFRVDLLIWNNIPPHFHEEIMQNKVILQNAA